MKLREGKFRLITNYQLKILKLRFIRLQGNIPREVLGLPLLRCLKLEWTEHYQEHPMVNEPPIVWNEGVHLGCLYKLTLPHDLRREEKKYHLKLFHTDPTCLSDWLDNIKIFFCISCRRVFLTHSWKPKNGSLCWQHRPSQDTCFQPWKLTSSWNS